MIVLQWCKTQVICLMILVYLGVVYLRDGRQLHKLTERLKRNSLFDALFVLSILGVFFDGATAYTVNYLDQIPLIVNQLLHFGMYVTYEMYMMLLFVYWIYVTVGNQRKGSIKPGYLLPGMIAIIITILFMPQVDYLSGKYTNYSMGISVYACYTSVVVYCVLSMVVIVTKYRYIPSVKGRNIVFTWGLILGLLAIQCIFPETLISCITITMTTIGIYINLENPSIQGLEHYQHEMVMGFATLVDNKDDSTGGHIRRSSSYAVLIAKNLRKNKAYRNVITKDFIDHLSQSAPMHDIGKIGIPDAILQKPGKLTEEEFAKMKEHPVIGGKIIADTFGHLFDGDYEDMAYQVAMYHHEKWNGKGYPEGLKGTEIPLCARIMAVADVFDAVSAKRCYRDAMPLDQCYRIISEGRGTDFDPDVVDAFMAQRERVEEIYCN